MTKSPRFFKARARWNPIKPAAPVTKIFLTMMNDYTILMKNRAIRIFIYLICMVLLGCSNPPYSGGGCSVGADEFIMDSYKIREGKFAILQMEGIETEPFPSEFLQEYKDVVHEDDVLKIVVFHPVRSDIVEAVASVSNALGFKVQEGKVVLPDLGDVYVKGLTLEEAREKIQEKYRGAIRDIDVFLDYKERIQRKVELAGRVNVPIIPVDGRLRLFEALAIAKVPPD